MAKARPLRLRLGVRDPADILRWAHEQNIRQLDDFRYRTIHGCNFVSFRMVPRYAIQVGTDNIVVIAHIVGNRRRFASLVAAHLARRCRNLVVDRIAALRLRPLAAPAHAAQVTAERSPPPSRSHG
jgi:hypothetical protein